MKKFIIASAAILASVGIAAAGATMEGKGGGNIGATNSNGSPIGKASSQVTGNGDWVGGNGTGTGAYGAGDQTTTPGSRADAVHDAQGAGAPGQNGK